MKVIRCCRKLIVLKIDGWSESRGVAREILEAGKIGIPIEYLTIQGNHHMNIREAVEALTDQYMRENDWPHRRAMRKALSVVRRKLRGVTLPPGAVQRSIWRDIAFEWCVKWLPRAAWLLLAAGMGYIARGVR